MVTKQQNTEYSPLWLKKQFHKFKATWSSKKQLTFKNRASYIWDGRTATLQMLHFIYIFFKQI